MRCPKCGYTSFDNLERCKKCKKNIAAAAAALMGTVASAVPPSFLAMANQTQDLEPGVAGAELELNIDEHNGLDFSSSEDGLFSLDEEAPAANSHQPVAELSEDSGIDLSLPDHFDDSPAQQEAAIDMELDLALDDLDEEPVPPGNAEENEIAAPSGLDLAGLDISDLQAPEAPAGQEAAFEPSLSLDGLDDEPAPVPPVSQEAAPADAGEFSLENLQVEGLAETKPEAPVADDQYQPGMKTGTALDNFNFDLDELLELNENEKA